MRHSFKTGFSFGLTSGIITTLGLIVGLHSGTNSRTVIIGGILTIAIADSFSDALGIHISEESEGKHSTREIWEATLSTLFFKFLFAMSFVLPIALLPIPSSIIVSIVWGLTLLSTFSYLVAKSGKLNPYRAVTEHLAVAAAVIFLTHIAGEWINRAFLQ
ncbi:MAG: hypothetical protein JSV21_03385 [Nitrospirota bacterium]|nr:MAG: hypothetical protein JSV21_03385 [Nitrospirota bacterium]